MKVYIMTDLEGVAGVVSFEDDDMRDSRYYERSKRLLAGETNAAVEGCLAAGATEILVVDGHGPGGLNPDEVHPGDMSLAQLSYRKCHPTTMRNSATGSCR